MGEIPKTLIIVLCIGCVTMITIFLIHLSILNKSPVVEVDDQDIKWTTMQADGQCEIMHGWGRSLIADVRGIEVTVRHGILGVSPLFNQPVLDGKQQKDFFAVPCGSAYYSSERDTYHLSDFLTTILFYQGEEFTVRQNYTVSLYMKEGKPTMASGQHVARALFDIEELRAKQRDKNTPFDDHVLEYLEDFEDNKRILSFYGEWM